MEASKIKTGSPVSLHYARNKKSSKDYKTNQDFGQKIEPHGEYMNLHHEKLRQNNPDWEYGLIEFKNPLVLDHKDSSSEGWKKDLSEMFGGKTGKALTEAIKQKGYDAVLTKDKYGYSESVNIGGTKKQYDDKKDSTEIVTSENRKEYMEKKLNQKR